MNSRAWALTGWRLRPAAVALSTLTEADSFRATCVHEAGHAIVGRSFGLEVKAVWANCSTKGGGCEFGKDGIGTWSWPRMVVTVAGIMAMRKAGFADEEHRAADDRKALEFFAQNDQRLIASAEQGAAGLVEKHWREIFLLSDYLLRCHGGSIDGPSIDALLAGHQPPAATALQTGALPASRLIAKPIATVKSASEDVGEIWRCQETGQIWFEAFLLRPPGEGKERVGKRFASRAEAAKALTAATARKAA
jgi:hypothetical protein